MTEALLDEALMDLVYKSGMRTLFYEFKTKEEINFYTIFLATELFLTMNMWYVLLNCSQILTHDLLWLKMINSDNGNVFLQCSIVMRNTLS